MNRATSLVSILSLTLMIGCNRAAQKDMTISATPRTPVAQAKQATVESLVDTRVALVKAQNDMQTAIASLEELTKPATDQRANFQQFRTALANTRDHAAAAQRRAESLRSQRVAYLARWEKEVSELNDPALKSSAQERVQQVRDTFGQITELADQARAAYEPFMTSMTDIEKYLAADLTPAGINNARPSIDNAVAQGKDVFEKLNQLINAVNGLSAHIAPSGQVPGM